MGKEKINQYFETNKGVIIILVSILIEIVLSLNGTYWESCGIKLVDILSILFAGLVSILLYQKLKQRFHKLRWLILLVSCGINIWLGLMFYWVVC